jgi:hypothetical protein
MGKLGWLAGAVGLLLGLAAGSACTYLWLKPQVAATSNQGAEAVVPPEPSEQEVQTIFQRMLADAGVDAEVVGFRRVNWDRTTIDKYREPDAHGELKLVKPFMVYSVFYEAELAFQGDCQMQEGFALMWSPENKIISLATGASAVMSTRETRSFKKGEHQQVRGQIAYTSRSGAWKLQPNWKIDAGS